MKIRKIAVELAGKYIEFAVDLPSSHNLFLVLATRQGEVTAKYVVGHVVVGHKEEKMKKFKCSSSYLLQCP